MKSIFTNKESFKTAYSAALKDRYNLTVKEATMSQLYQTLASLVNANLDKNYDATTKYVKDNNLKKTIYFSMEFLMGRLITNNLQNSGYYNVVKEAFADFNIDLNKVEDAEADTGLGNGGLGRLAACFLDSAASINLPLYGNSLGYRKEFFIKEFVNNKKIEKPDNGLEKGLRWKEENGNKQMNIQFNG